MKHLERALYPKNEVWRYIVLFLIAFIGGQLIGSTPLGIAILAKMFTLGNIADITPENAMDLSVYGLSNNLGLALMMFSFVGIFFTFALLVKPFHGRTLKETINGRKHVRWNRVWMGILVWGIIMLIQTAIGLLTAAPGDFEFRFNPSVFLVLVLIVIIIVPFQTSAEEILFRGYLAQGAAKWTRSRWWALIIPSVLFALMHMANPEVKEFGFWLAMPQYLIMGLMLGIISILDDGIEIALGIHFINNALSAVLITHESSVLQTDALFLVHNIDPKSDLIVTAVASIIVVLVLQRIYKWDFGIMNKKVEHEMPPIPSMQTEVVESVQDV